MLKYLIKLTPVKPEQAGDASILELDCRRIVGWMSIPPSASLVYTDIPNENRVFSVRESTEEIKKQYAEIMDSVPGNDLVSSLTSLLGDLPDDDFEDEIIEGTEEKAEDSDSAG